MARIIDFKTRQVLADYPYKTTPKQVKGYQIDDAALKNRVFLIARHDWAAKDILNQINRDLGIEKAKKVG